MKVARAENRIQAEFIEGLLLEEGIPCVLSGLIAGYALHKGAGEARKGKNWTEVLSHIAEPVSA